MERFCELVAAMKLRTTNQKGRHLSTVRALDLLVEHGIETPDGLVRAPPGLLTRTTVNRYLRAWGLDDERMSRPPPAQRFQAEHVNACWQLDLSPSDLKQVPAPLWVEPGRGPPILMLFSAAVLADKNAEGEVGNRRLAVVKLRSAPTGRVVPFRLKSVAINQGGSTSCGVEWALPADGAPPPPSEPAKPAWTGKARILKNAIERAMLDHGQDVRPWGANETQRRAVERKQVRVEFYASYAADDIGTKRKAFKRLMDDALSRSLIAARDIAGVDWLWIVRESEQ